MEKVRQSVPVALVLALLTSACASGPGVRVSSNSKKHASIVLEVDGNRCKVVFRSEQHRGRRDHDVDWWISNGCAETHRIEIGAFVKGGGGSCPAQTPSGTNTASPFVDEEAAFGKPIEPGTERLKKKLKKDLAKGDRYQYCIFMDGGLAKDPEILIDE